MASNFNAAAVAPFGVGKPSARQHRRPQRQDDQQRAEAVTHGEPLLSAGLIIARLPLAVTSERPGLRPVSRRHTRFINERRGWLRWTGSTPPLSALAGVSLCLASEMPFKFVSKSQRAD